METLFNSLSSVMLILLLTATGYFCAALGWLSPSARAFVSKFVLNVAVPATCLYGLSNNLSRELLRESGGYVLVPVVLFTLLYLLAYAVGRLLRLPRRRLGVFMVMCAMSNAIFVGYAMCRELFGPDCTPYSMLYYLVSTVFVQTIGMALIRWSGEAEQVSMKKTLRKMLTYPPTLGVIVGVLLVWNDLRLPGIINTYCGYMNDLVSPLALLLTGYIIYDIGLKNLRFDLALGVVTAFRFLLAPALTLGLCAAFGVEGFPRSVMMVQTTMPVLTQAVVASTEFGADEQFAAQGAALTTLACFAVIPALMLFLNG